MMLRKPRLQSRRRDRIVQCLVRLHLPCCGKAFHEYVGSIRHGGKSMRECKHHMVCLIGIVSCILLVHVVAWAQQPKSGGTLRVEWEADIAGDVHTIQFTLKHPSATLWREGVCPLTWL
jgi:hypothetical protein